MSDSTPTAPPSPTLHSGLPVSDWVRRWAHLVPAGSTVLDVACGSGRHTRWFHGLGCTVTSVDRDAAALQALEGVARTVVADLEAAPWPLPGTQFHAVVVTNYLWRALWPDLVGSLADSGVLIYETFAQGNARVGKPSNPAFLLKPGELLQVAAEHGLRVVAYEDGFCTQPDRYVQRLVAARLPAAADASAAESHRHLLHAP